MTDADYPSVPHLAWPLRLAAHGGLAAVEQDTLEDVQQCVAVMVRTPLGARPLAPEMGVDDPTFDTGVNATLLERAVEEQEPRAAAVVRVHDDGRGEVDVQVEVRLADEEGTVDDVVASA